MTSHFSLIYKHSGKPIWQTLCKSLVYDWKGLRVPLGRQKGPQFLCSGAWTTLVFEDHSLIWLTEVQPSSCWKYVRCHLRVISNFSNLRKSEESEIDYVHFYSTLLVSDCRHFKVRCTRSSSKTIYIFLKIPLCTSKGNSDHFVSHLTVDSDCMRNSWLQIFILPLITLTNTAGNLFFSCLSLSFTVEQQQWW